jgi:uncharacterized OB-fold protein
MTPQARRRRRYLALAAAGRCVLCGRAPARPSRKTCPDCGRRNSVVSARRVRRLAPLQAALGVCAVCHARLAMPGRKWCAVCAEAHAENTARLRDKRRRAGRCPRCGRAAAPGRVWCTGCGQTAAARSRARRALAPNPIPPIQEVRHD